MIARVAAEFAGPIAPEINPRLEASRIRAGQNPW